DLESRFQITITINADATVGAAQPFLIEKGELVHSVEAAKAILAQQPAAPAIAEDDEDEFEDIAEDETEDVAEAGEAEADADASEQADADGSEGTAPQG